MNYHELNLLKVESTGLGLVDYPAQKREMKFGSDSDRSGHISQKIKYSFFS